MSKCCGPSGRNQARPMQQGRDGDDAFTVWRNKQPEGADVSWNAYMAAITGSDGDSAYQVWAKEQPEGADTSVEAFLTAITGADGKSAYDVWVEQQPEGTDTSVEAFLTAITGADGESAYDVWAAEQPEGADTSVEAFLMAITGADGESAYQVWVKEQPEGADTSVEAFLKDITGDDGESAYQVWVAEQPEGADTSVEAFLESITGAEGKSAYDVWVAEQPEGADTSVEAFLAFLQGGSGSVTPAYQQTVLSWTGSSPVAIDTVKNLLELVTVSKTHVDTAGATITPGFSLKLPAVSTPTGVSIRVRMTGSIAGTEATTRSWLVLLRDNAGNLIDGQRVTKVNSLVMDGSNTSIETSTENESDILTTQGGRIILDNKTAAQLTITSVEILIKRTLGSTSTVPAQATSHRQTIFSWAGNFDVLTLTSKNLLELVKLNPARVNTAFATIGPSQQLLLPAIATPTGLTIRVAVTGFVGGITATRSWSIELHKMDGSYVDGQKLAKSNTVDIDSGVSIDLAMDGVADFMVVQGGRILFNNPSTSTMTLYTVEITVKRTL